MNEFYITTSWDDGHPLDLKLAQVLIEREIKGTFYIPRTSERAVLTPAQIRQLAANFEIGAHTLGHVDLTTVDAGRARAEIADSRDWVEQVTGKECRMFCFPKGRFRKVHLQFVSEAGYHGCRTTELLSLKNPSDGPLRIMGTSVQVFPHHGAAYLRNSLKRLRPANLTNLRPFVSAWKGNWLELGHRMLQTVRIGGGVFHPWGHSWEIEERDQWTALSALLEEIAEYVPRAQRRTNGELCSHV